MKFRKPVAFLAAIMMLLSSSPAFAASTGDSHQTVIQARCLVPEVTIQVVVPTESQVFVNPQSLPVKLDGKISQSQILSEPARIENQTEVPLSVSATVSGTKMEGSDIILSSASNLISFEVEIVNPVLDVSDNGTIFSCPIGLGLLG